MILLDGALQVNYILWSSKNLSLDLKQERDMTEGRLNFEVLEKTLGMGQERAFVKADADLNAFRGKMLSQLANLDLSHKSVERTLAIFEPEAQNLFASAQRDLRDIWQPSMPIAEKQRIVDVWLATTKRQGRAGVHAWLARGRLEFDFQSFPGQFVTAILENWWRFQVCANPECAARYFYAKRNTQRYCERGECTRYANQQYALNYWNTKGKQRRKAKGAK